MGFDFSSDVPALAAHPVSVAATERPVTTGTSEDLITE